MRQLIFLFSWINFLFRTCAPANFTYAASFDSYFLSKNFSSSDGTPWNDTNAYSYSMGDVNGDGKYDLVAFGISYVYVALSNGITFLPPTIWSTNYSVANGWYSWDLNPKFVKDVNGDGKADIVGYSNSTQKVALSNGTYFVGYATWCSSFAVTSFSSYNLYPKLVADINGDGKGDLLGFGSGVTSAILSSGTAFATGETASTNMGTSTGWANFNVSPRLAADINGDGKADAIGFKSGVTGVYIAMNNASVFSTKVLWTSQFGSTGEYLYQNTTPRYAADINGDGKADIIGFGTSGVYAEISTGTSLGNYTLMYSYSDDNGVHLLNANSFKLFGDVNGDGKKDIVVVTNTGNGIKVFLSGVNDTTVLTSKICYFTLK